MLPMAGAPRRLFSRRDWPVWLVAAAVLVVLAITSGEYGYHRDELYFLASGRRLAWGIRTSRR